MSARTVIRSLLRGVVLFVLLLPANALAATFTVRIESDHDCTDFDCELVSALRVAQSNGEADTIDIAAGIHFVGSPSYVADASENFALSIHGADEITILVGFSCAGILGGARMIGLEATDQRQCPRVRRFIRSNFVADN